MLHNRCKSHIFHLLATQFSQRSFFDNCNIVSANLSSLFNHSIEKKNKYLRVLQGGQNKMLFLKVKSKVKKINQIDNHENVISRFQKENKNHKTKACNTGFKCNKDGKCSQGIGQYSSNLG
ncbi:hypothetical protein ABPG72_002609 [Tetrahymena utriculariae]